MGISNSLITWIEQLSRGNQFLAGALSMYGLGILTYLFRSIPMRIYGFLLKHLTTTMCINSSHEVYHLIMRWMEKEGVTAKLRNLKLSNGRWGYSDEVTKGAGYGSHIVWFKKIPIKIIVSKEDNKGDNIIDTLTMVSFGRSHSIFNSLILESTKKEETEKRTKIYMWSGKDWCYSRAQQTRSFSTVYLEDSEQTILLNGLNAFMSKEKWYIEKGVPYRMGILLHGHPGTGKTSVIKAIAAHLDLNLCILPVRSLFYLERAVESLPDKSILVIEDIDSSSLIKARSSELASKLKKREAVKVEESPTPSSDRAASSVTEDVPNLISGEKRKTDPVSEDLDEEQLDYLRCLFDSTDGGLSTILNAIDGISDSFGRILVMTTNRPRILDAALTRPGRIDLTVEVGFVSYSVFVKFMKNFFPDFIPPIGRSVLPEITVAMLQQAVLENMLPETICSKFLNNTESING